MSMAHLLIVVLPSLLAGLLWGRSFLTGAFWGLVAEGMGLILVFFPIAGGPRTNLSFRMVALSILLGAFAGLVGYSLQWAKRSS
jgi:hypothetical protein